MRIHTNTRSLLRLCSCAALLSACASPIAHAPAPVEYIPIAPVDEPLDGEAPPPPKTSEADEALILQLRNSIKQFAPAQITANVTDLPENERAALHKLIEASKHLEAVFERQASANNPALAQRLANDESDLGQLRLAYFKIMRGPWDRQKDHARFAGEQDYYPGAGFYPTDLTSEKFDAYLGAHPDETKSLTGLFTLVSRKGDKLVATPYHKAYAKWLEPAAKRMEEAAELTKNASLSTFLRSRAAAFATDDYYQSDLDWMDLNSRVEVTIGPYEVYEDKLKGYKASYESFVTVSDPVASKNLAKYKGLLPDMEKHLPIPRSMRTVRGSESPIRVVDLVFTAGDARKSIQTIAFNLPNDERVRKTKGAKKVLLRNLIEKKFDLILRPIAARIISSDQQQFMSAPAFFNQVLFHELSHSLGPAHTKKDGKKVEVRVALESSYSAIEECKADVMGAYNTLYMIERGEFPKDFREKALASYFAGLFRSVRFGVSEAHGKGAAVQINRFLEDGAAAFDAKTGRFTVDFAKLETAITNLTRDLCVLQHNGDKGAADELLSKYGTMSPSMSQALGSVNHVPVDIRPIYPMAGEK